MRRNISLGYQLFISIGIVVLVSGIGFLSVGVIGYRLIGFLLLATVSILAVLFPLTPVLTSAFLSALIWDYFFIPPHFTFHIRAADDLAMLLMYFVVALVNAAFTIRIRKLDEQHHLQREKEKTVQLYNTVLNSLSHELRTPIATIQAATDNLKWSNTKLNSDEQQYLVDEIAAAAQRLNRQVGNLLNMSRLDSGSIKPKLDWCDINELVFTTINLLGPSAQNITLNVSIPDNTPMLRTDSFLLEQILYNLLHNAIVHTHNHPHVELAASFQDGTLVISVADNGPGLTQAESTAIFQKFHRLHSAHPGGIGLGLSIVQGFTHALSGHISVMPSHLGGASFVVSIPMEPLKSLVIDAN